MVKLLDIPGVCHLVHDLGYQPFIERLIGYLTHDFANWDQFNKIPRPAAHFDHGVIELMPIWNEQYYTYKYVNGHPCNTDIGKLTVAALGQISDVKTGYPLLISEMTILTAIRTAAVSALASSLLARPNSSTLAIIGTGAQSEFQVLAQQVVLPLKTVRYFDPNKSAMDKFTLNMQEQDLQLVPCDSIDAALDGADVVITLTAAKCKNHIITVDQVRPGVHINALGGDCPGKTELEKAILEKAKVVVEFFAQSHIEGEIQEYSAEEARRFVHAELHEIIRHQRPGRETDTEITVFDGVGVALEDFSVLRLVYDICQQQPYAKDVDLIPDIDDPRNLITILKP